MSVSGLRVLRGPDWRGGDTDGGEGHVGTVIELLGNHTVRVLWDMGQESTCSAGHDGKCELRVLDSAQIGVRHPNTRCSNCGESDTYGMLWRCRDCTGCDLCPLCYSDDKHNPRHQFLRVDVPGIEGQPVPKRKTSVKHRCLGLFPGSKVTRGRDWQWGDQDGGQGSEGEVKGYENVSPDSSRDLLQVEWPSGNVNSYRVGFHGNVDVTCVEEEVGPYYYRDHLPVLDRDQIRKLSKSKHNASGNPDQSETQKINSGNNHTLAQPDSALLSIPGHSPPESKTPTDSIPGHNTSENKAPTVSIPGHNPPNSKAPIVSIPDHNPPDSKAPTVSIPGHNTPESKTPTVSIPGHNPPESKTPTVSIPDHNPPNSKAPTVSIPDHNTPDSKTPTVSIPDHNPPESKTPTDSIPGHNTPENKAPTVSIPGHNPPDSKAPTVSIPDHNTPDSKAPTVSIPDHNPPDSKAPTVSIPGHNPPDSKAPTVSILGHNPPDSKAPTVSILGHNPPDSKAPTVSIPGHNPSDSKTPTVSIPDHNPPNSKAPTVSIPGPNPPGSKAPTVSIPGHNPPDSKAPTVSILGHNPPDSKTPTVSIPGHNTPDSKAPTVSIPDHNPPNSKAPTVSIPGHNPPNSKAPTDSLPGHSPPKSKTPTVSIPDHNPPDTKTPTVSIPDHNPPDSKAPTVSIPGHNTPDSKVPTVSIPGHNLPDSKAPTVSIPGHNTPDSKAPTVSIPGHNTPESKTPTVSIPGHNTPDSMAPTVSIPDHNPPNSKALTVGEADTSTDDPGNPKMLTERRTSSCSSDGGPSASVEEIHDVSGSEGNKAREEITSSDRNAQTPGARVAVRVGVKKLLQLQQQCGADTEDLKRVLGKTGHVTGTTDNGSVTVKFLGEDVVMNAKALVTVQEFKRGDKVRLGDKMDEMKVLNCRVGWKDGMDETAGKVGQVLTVDSEGDLLVSFGRQRFLFAPACCTHVTSDTPVDSLKLDSARMKKPESNRSWSGARIDINHIAGESKVLFKDLQDTVMSDSSGRPSLILSLTSGLNPGRVLHAAQRGDHHTVREMCTANTSLIEVEQQRSTPLIIACNYGQREVVRVLLELGADVNHGVSRSRYPLASMLCSPQKDEEIALMLLDKGADPFGLDESRHTHMHTAAVRNLPRLTKALADRGVDVNAVDDFGDTALHLAISRPSYDVIEVLLAIPSIDLSIKNINNCPALHHACSHGAARAVEMLLDIDKSQVNRAIRTYTALHHAAHSDHDDCVRIMVLKGGADVNRGGAPPLSLACVRGMYRAAEALMELGADIHSRDGSGNTPLHHVMDGRRIEDQFGEQSDQEIQVRVALACLLVSNGAPLDVRDSEGRTPLSCGVPALREGVDSFIRNKYL